MALIISFNVLTIDQSVTTKGSRDCAEYHLIFSPQKLFVVLAWSILWALLAVGLTTGAVRVTTKGASDCFR